MARPGTHSFIGPLTPAQQRRRNRSRDNWNQIRTVQDAFNASFSEAIHIISEDRKHGEGRPYRLSEFLT